MRVILNSLFDAYTLTPVNKRVAMKLAELVGEDCLLFQVDWDYPRLAQDLGWNMSNKHCEHNGTDGTVTCPECGRTADEFIGRARAWLDKRCGYGINLKDFSSFPDLETAWEECFVPKSRGRRK